MILGATMATKRLRMKTDNNELKESKTPLP